MSTVNQTGAPAKIREAMRLPRGNEYVHAYGLDEAIRAFHDGYSIRPPDVPYAFAVSKVWRLRGGILKYLRFMTADASPEDVRAAQAALALLDDALIDWGTPAR